VGAFIYSVETSRINIGTSFTVDFSSATLSIRMDFTSSFVHDRQKHLPLNFGSRTKLIFSISLQAYHSFKDVLLHCLNAAVFSSLFSNIWINGIIADTDAAFAEIDFVISSIGLYAATVYDLIDKIKLV